MLGKRARPTFRRTTSMKDITFDLPPALPPPPAAEFIVSPRYLRRNLSADSHVEMADFLRRCGLCNRRLAPARDIYIYRGDTAFCSIECREEQMKQDERNERQAAGDPHHSQLAAASPETDRMAAV